jgi:hypothetical protein
MLCSVDLIQQILQGSWYYVYIYDDIPILTKGVYSKYILMQPQTIWTPIKKPFNSECSILTSTLDWNHD